MSSVDVCDIQHKSGVWRFVWVTFFQSSRFFGPRSETMNLPRPRTIMWQMQPFPICIVLIFDHFAYFFRMTVKIQTKFFGFIQLQNVFF